MPAAKIRRTLTATSSGEQSQNASQEVARDDVELITLPSLKYVALKEFRPSMIDVMCILRVLACSPVSQTQKGVLFVAVYIMDSSMRNVLKVWGDRASLVQKRDLFQPGKVAVLVRPYSDSWGLKIGRKGALSLVSDSCVISPSETAPAETLLEDTLEQCANMADDCRVELHIYVLAVEEVSESQKNVPYVRGRFVDEQKKVMKFVGFGTYATDNVLSEGSFYYLYNAKGTNSKIMVLTETGYVTDVPTFDINPPLSFL